MAQSITLTNLLTNPSFENTGWAASSACSITYATSPKHSGSYSLKVTSTSSSESLIVTSDKYTIIPDHIYYVSVWFYEASNVCSEMQCYWPIAEPLMGSAYPDSSKLNQWQKLSWRNVRSNWSTGTSAQFRFDFEGMATNTIAYIDDAMLIDLTACFGSGNEPTIDWCDNNIDYFSGSKVISYKAPNIYDLTSAIPSKLETNDILNCPYSGRAISLILPKGQYELQCWGAQGGSGGARDSTYPGGKGGYSQGIITLNEKTQLYLYAGGQGIGNNVYNASGTIAAGGFNGGGSSTSRSGNGGGGGASDIRVNIDSLYARIIVAGGGGGNSTYQNLAGFAGGGLYGKAVNNSDTSSGTTYYGGGGSQTGGGAVSPSGASWCTAGSFGNGGVYSYSASYYGSGGGGGWYGGGAAICNAGGGSGYIYTASTASNYPSGCLLNSSYYLSNAQTIAGNNTIPSITGSTETGHSGNGYIRITVLEVKNTDAYVKIDSSTWAKQKQIFINTGSSSTVPSGLVELDYIENTGTSYINTGFNPDSLTKTVITFQMTANDGTHQVIFGSRASSSSMQYLLGFAGHQSPALWRSDYGTNQTTFTSSLTYNTKYTCTKDGAKCTLASETNTHTAVTFSSSYPIYLFACNTSNAVGNNMKAKIYSCQIYDAGALVRYFIPAKRISDGMCGLWDKVNYKFYTDENGNNFTAGSEKSAIASPGTTIEYIEATGTQYINTGVKPTQDYKIKVKYQTTQTSAGGIATSDTAWGNTGFGVWVNAGEYGNSNNSSLVLYGSTPNEVTFDKNGLILNGTNIWTPTSSTFTVTNNMTIFALNRNNSVQEYLTGKIYYVKIYDGDTLIRDFIPMKTASNTYGLWDRVNKVFYENSGTGTFTGGSTVSLSGWRSIKSIWVKTDSSTWKQAL